MEKEFKVTRRSSKSHLSPSLSSSNIQTRSSHSIDLVRDEIAIEVEEYSLPNSPDESPPGLDASHVMDPQAFSFVPLKEEADRLNSPRRTTLVRSNSAGSLRLSVNKRLSSDKAEIDHPKYDRRETVIRYPSLHKTHSSPSLYLSDSITDIYDPDGIHCDLSDLKPANIGITEKEFRNNMPGDEDTPSSGNPSSEQLLHEEVMSDSNLFRDSQHLHSFFRWVTCFCVVNFDLEMGQAIECIYPTCVQLSEQEKKNVSFSAFPDSNSSSHVGDSTFHFRFRSGPFTANLYKQVSKSDKSNEGSPTINRSRNTSVSNDLVEMLNINDEEVPSKISQLPGSFPLDTDGHTYGYVFFRQQSDIKIRRGFFQKSLVILTPHPWKGLYQQLVKVLGARFMDCIIGSRSIQEEEIEKNIPGGVANMGLAAMTLLNRAFKDISSWPSPLSQSSPYIGTLPVPIILPFLNTNRVFIFPPTPRTPLLYENTQASKSTSRTDISPLQSEERLNRQRTGQVPSSLACPGNFYDIFSRSLDMMWMCWELVVIGEPILIIADIPKGASDTVSALVELVKPIPYGGDYRPYFTIQDSDFKFFASRSRPPPSATILGVTNQVFDNLLQHWPHTIKVAKIEKIGNNTSFNKQGSSSPWEKKGKSSKSTGVTPTAMKSFMQALGGKTQQNTFEFDTSLPNQKSGSANRLYPGQALSVIHSITCKHKPFFSKDKKLLKDVVEAAIRGKGEKTLNNMLRRHFVELTDSFLLPLNEYFESLIVGSHTRMTLSTLRTKPEIRPFKQESFLKAIELNAPSFPISSKRNPTELYRLFLKSPNFASWLQSRTSEVYRDWQRQYLSVICETDILAWGAERINVNNGSNVECVDLLLRIRDELNRYSIYFKRDPLDDNKLKYANPSEPYVLPDTVVAPPKRIPVRGAARDRKASNAPIQHSFRDQYPKEFSNFHGSSSAIGGVIPSVKQYDLIIEQADILLGMLPEDLRVSFLVSE